MLACVGAEPWPRLGNTAGCSELKDAGVAFICLFCFCFLFHDVSLGLRSALEAGRQREAGGGEEQEQPPVRLQSGEEGEQTHIRGGRGWAAEAERWRLSPNR